MRRRAPDSDWQPPSWPMHVIGTVLAAGCLYAMGQPSPPDAEGRPAPLATLSAGMADRSREAVVSIPRPAPAVEEACGPRTVARGRIEFHRPAGC